MKERPCDWNDEWNDLPEDMRRFATRIGPTDAHALLLGPPGSGKGYLARILHELSERSGGSFVAQNCGVFTETLAEAKLFGFMKGAYTGATESKPGLVEAAAGGTLFLDEFGALPDAIQPMFLTFLETGEFSRVGSTTVRKANVRVIAATNRDLRVAIAEDEFREDLGRSDVALLRTTSTPRAKAGDRRDRGPLLTGERRPVRAYRRRDGAAAEL